MTPPGRRKVSELQRAHHSAGGNLGRPYGSPIPVSVRDGTTLVPDGIQRPLGSPALRAVKKSVRDMNHPELTLSSRSSSR